MLKTIFPSFILISLLSLGTTCTSPTEPGKENGPDTTSQNFSFETFEFGDGNASSYLNDVWIFDENNIWAVGYISKTETNPAGNIIQWNGKEWKIKTSLSVSNGMTGIWAVDSNNVYLTTGLLRKYQNGQIIQIPFPFSLSIGQAVTKLWGSSATNIWGVGPNGTVVHYDGVGWKKVELDTNIQLFDVHGIKEIIYTNWSNNNSTEGGLYLLKNGVATEFYKNSSYPNWYKSHLFVQDEKTAISGSYPPIRINLNEKKSENLLKISPELVVYSSYANSVADIFLWGTAETGSGLKLVHFNGIRLYKKFFSHSFVGFPKKVVSKRDITVIVGDKENKGFISIIRRSK